jgi:O-antigen ligase
MMNMIIFSQLFLYPKSKQDFVDMLGIFACVILFLSYFGAIFVPSGAIHLEADGYDVGLAGAWRGIFTQKNAAGGFFSFCTFIGILCFNYGRKPLGLAIFFLSVLFIFLAKSKTALGFVFIVNFIAYFIVYTRLSLLSLLGTFVFIGGINLFTVGTIFFPPLAEFLEKQGIDTTFTGRTPLWEFCLQGVEDKPWLGHGSQGFWNQPHIKLGGTAAEEWIHQMGSAHNGLLENLLNVGYIGSFFIICFAFIMPALDIYKIQSKGLLKTSSEKAILFFLVQTWIFFWCASTTESSFYVFFGIGFNVFTFVIFGFRYMANFSFR